MESKFLTELAVQEVGEGTWQLLGDLKYQSELFNGIIVAPVGFLTDFASVPRVPIAYTAFGDRAHRESTLHDFLYFTALVSKVMADKIFLEAMKARNKQFWVRWSMYIGVRVGGSKAWNEHRKQGHPNS